MTKKKKAVVFDLDETIGNFIQLGIFWDAYKQYFPDATQDDFFKILDTFYDYFRPNIMTIFTYLKHKKQQNKNLLVMIYTNNQGPKSWTEMIKNYIEHKINFKLFDQVIGAFKVNGRHVEICRTTHDKTVADFLNCTHLPPNTQICFLDDQMHERMEHERVYYINLKPYTFSMPFDEMIRKYLSSPNARKVENVYKFKRSMKFIMSRYNYTPFIKESKEMELDKIITKKVMIHLQKFLKHKQTKHKNNKPLLNQPKGKHYKTKRNK